MNTIGETHGVVVLIDPRGEKHHVENLAQFVEDNWELFDSDEDIKKRKCPEHEDGRKNGFYTRADRGLDAVVRGVVESWKGWTRG